MKVGYYLNYIYNLVVTPIIVFVNYSSIFNFKFYNSQFFYLFSLIIIIIITIYFIKYKMLYEHYNLSKKLKFEGKCIFKFLFFFLYYIFILYIMEFFLNFLILFYHLKQFIVKQVLLQW